MIAEINDILAKDVDEETKLDVRKVEEVVVSKLSEDVKDAFKRLPLSTRDQLLLDRDPHGNVQVAKIETEKLMVEMVSNQLNEEKQKGNYKGVFDPKTHYFGYEGRCAYPSNFDCDYTWGLGQTAACLIENKQTGMMSTIKNLAKSRDEWVAGGYPLTNMIHIEKRHGKKVPVIKKALVELDKFLFKTYDSQRDLWAEKDYFCQVGPIQFSCQSLEKAPYLSYKKIVDLFLSQDIPRKTYEASKLPYAKVSIDNMSRLGYYRAKEGVKVPTLLDSMKFEITIGSKVGFKSSETEANVCENLTQVYNNQFGSKMIEFVEQKSRPYAQKLLMNKEQKIGVLFCGRQSPGGINVIAGLLEFCKKNNSI